MCVFNLLVYFGSQVTNSLYIAAFNGILAAFLYKIKSDVKK